MLYDVAVIGAGPAGLYAADLVAKRGHSVVVLEGRDRIGGRLLSVGAEGGNADENGNTDGNMAQLDLGATWFWSNEAQVNEVIAQEQLHVFAQHLDGDAMFQNDQGSQRMQGNQVDAPSGRLLGGTQSIAHALAGRLDDSVLHLSQQVIAVALNDDVVTLVTNDRSWQAKQVIIAVPPSTAVARIDMAPLLSQRVHALAAATPVWMGGIVKIVAHYDRAFWRDEGLAGSAFSYTGPMREVHDMSGPNGEPAAIFGFAQPGAGSPTPADAEVLAQLVELFGPQAGSPRQLFVHDWRNELLTSPDNVDDLGNYQTYGHPLFAEPVFDGRGHWASTETATTAPGHIEGALQAATRAADAASAAIG